VNLGYEPQWVLIKPTNEVNSWVIVDTMRGYSLGAGDAGEDARLRPNTSDAESTSSNVGYPTATGFYVAGSGSMQHIYIAIRRGPMKVPTLGTSVYNAVVRTGTRAVANLTGLGFTPDTAFVFDRNAQSADSWFDRLRGVGIRLRPHDTGAEQTFSDTVTAFNMDGISYGADATANSVNYSLTSNAYINWFFKRAPGFFDEVCYTGTGSNTTQTHNLGVVPELMIIKRRSAIGSWCTFFGMGASNYYRPLLNSDVSAPLVTYSDGFGLSAQPTSTVINLDSGGAGNDSGTTYVAYLFATCAGVSKVGTYTGTGTTQTINCGFTGGARFVLIKRTDSTGDWYVWDSARGIVSGNDSYLLLNSTAAEVTSTDYIDTASTGFEISSTAPAAINANGGSFIFLAIA
jgi:hypothetical protein